MHIVVVVAGVAWAAGLIAMIVVICLFNRDRRELRIELNALRETCERTVKWCNHQINPDGKPDDGMAPAFLHEAIVRSRNAPVVMRATRKPKRD